jgi:AraC-like DNA-binding protein
VTAEYVPTDAQRSLVESASAFGITQAEIATQLKISEPTLRKHFRDELVGGAFKANMKVGGNMYALTQSADEQVRLRACQWWTARRMGWKETNVNEQVGKDGGPIETKDMRRM